MGTRASYAPGTFCWADLGTTDIAEATAFYSGLFGWESEEMGSGPDDAYTMLRKGGANVAGLYAMNDEMRAGGVPPHWLSYVSVDDADASAARANHLGATVVAEPFDVLQSGRMSLLQDPQGALFVLWQAGDHAGAAVVNEVGALCWNDLATSDLHAAQGFYGDLFGWHTEPANADPPYLVIRNGEATNGGMMPIARPGMPPNWTAYFAVDSVDDAVREVGQRGGSTFAGPMDVPAGRMAVVADPQGAIFGLFAGEDFDP